MQNDYSCGLTEIIDLHEDYVTGTTVAADHLQLIKFGCDGDLGVTLKVHAADRVCKIK